MKNNKILCAFLAALLSFSVVSCGNSDDSSEEKSSSSQAETESVTEDNDGESSGSDEKSDDEKTVNIDDYISDKEPAPALWKVTDTDTGNELYMMGTIHVVSENKFSLPDYIMDVYENCDGVAVEYNVNELNRDMNLMQEFLTPMVYTDGTTIKDHLSEETYEKAKAYYQENGMYNSLMDAYVPGFWINQIQALEILNLDNLSSEGVDSTFIKYAENDGKEVVNIETLDIQADAISGYSDELADYVLSDLVDNIDDTEAMAESISELYNLWASGDVDAMAAIDESEMDEIPDDLKDDYDDYQNIMLYDRNKSMADKAEEFLKNGDNYFFMVGSMHFAGDKGVPALLSDMGYTVERVE